MSLDMRLGLVRVVGYHGHYQGWTSRTSSRLDIKDIFKGIHQGLHQGPLAWTSSRNNSMDIKDIGYQLSINKTTHEPQHYTLLASVFSISSCIPYCVIDA
ncbi:uncharacterized protein K460DRAFT_369520 [Cucurbitaria berberidis CBS 394.84]|uniref:Uncharacterized protein n=1 Tax=Cucurbitaria berberidis CBS 394.84 TaxID=1168544 RepID=A0A9P4L4H3_9PLEO|nr:uncharacterized protein K460DRAFT_369520 [Cucurbitaria berberidis CBS 394.84]KAF1841490.1 hypothetical protein K460DRAFT_369520 [Cucurbitaria berberidis CBS 394.84]